MDSKVISICMPAAMLRKVDEAAAAEYQTRSNFIRMCIVHKFGAHSQHDTYAFPSKAPDFHTDKQLSKMYDFPEQYDDLFDVNGEAS